MHELFTKEMRFLGTLQFSLCVFALCLGGCRTKPKIDLNYQPKGPTVTEKRRTDTNLGTGLSASQTGVGGDAYQNEAWNSSWKDSIDFTPIQTESEDWELKTATPVTSIDSHMAKVEDQRWGPIYFAFNQSFIGETERVKLETLADYLLQNTHYDVIIEGHCDERGSEEYNRALGEKRAIAVRDYLARIGVNDARMQTISYGEERLADFGHTEEAHSRNRRVEFIIGHLK